MSTETKKGVISGSLPVILGQYTDYNFKFTEVEIPNARFVNGRKYPVAIKLTYTKNNEASDDDSRLYEELAQFVYDLSKDYDTFKTLVRKFGALAIKGFNSTDPENFSLFVRNFAKGSNLSEFKQNGIAHPREDVAKGGVTTVNKTTGFRRLYAHQELCRFKTYPSILTFFAKYPSKTGGDETLTNASELYNVVKQKYPEFIDAMAKKGIYLTQTWPLGQKLPNGKVYSWKSEHSFGRLIKEGDDLETQKRKAGEICKKYVSEDYEWTKDGGMKINEHTKPIRLDPYNKEPIIFGSIPSYYQKYKWNLENIGPNIPPAVTYDNGEQIPLKYLNFILEQSIELSFDYKFEAGDIVLVDNYTSYHGRTKYGDQRREILACFLDDDEQEKKVPIPFVSS
ncbi:DEBR0S2_00144g1_1 [Brettanomyces bruxellensis]|uniref:DEBR0S2_00144g1_1 n=1 Tax=Dekkera bruxellensis TaxID=5007 RepID=A0A7D9GYH5_DEKBR|nr:DEBR0S2_00144g1_1 [Brettanomyces bruxellensis]